MKDLVEVKQGKIVVTSKQIADHFGKVHRNVMRDINSLIEDMGDDIGVLSFEHSSYTSEQNKVLPCYIMGRDEFSLVAMGFTGKPALKWKLAYIKAFNKMEELLLSDSGVSVMQSLNDAMRLMEQDKQIASHCGKGLNAWKEQRRDHMQRVEKLHNEVQILLNFDK